jgi:hypothetical protein
MLALMVMRLALRAFSVMFGSFGVFFLYLSFHRPGLGACALLFLGTATAIDWTVPQN